MNTDFIVWDEPIRERQFRKNISSNGDTRHYSDSCKTIKQYAKEQNTVYNPKTNEMLYGINSNMHVSGVSDGTCNQINPLIYTPRYICGAGAAGGNRCVPDAYPQAYSIATPEPTQQTNPFAPIKLVEGFAGSNSNQSDSCDVTQYVVGILLIILLIGMLYLRTNKDAL
jgi:hypothetical protein